MRRLIVFIILFGLLIATTVATSISYAKYVIDSSTVAANLDIDRTKPTGIVNYSTKDPTKENVIVTINLSEPICEVQGWNLSKDKLILTKEYRDNECSTIKILDLSGNENAFDINVNNIDREPPKIELLKIKNTNENYEKYANKTHTIIATLKITDMKIKSCIDSSNIDVIVGDSVSNCTKIIQNLNQTDTEIEFDLLLTNVEGDGSLKLSIPEAFVIDAAGNSILEKEFDLNITIDNISPAGEYSQESLQNGKIKAYIKTNEEIRLLEQWQNSNNKTFSKTFPANVSYLLEIMDYAENKSKVEVNVTNATYIIFEYAAHNSNIGWTYGLGNYDIAGKKAVQTSPILKIEALAFRITGKADSNFVKFRGYVNSYWNNLSDYGKCKNTGYKYRLREAPDASGTSYYTMSSPNLSTINNKKYIQFGGAGINMIGNTDYNGKNPIPYDAIQGKTPFPYGISGLEVKLKDYTELSVVYQILVYGKGWLKTCTNGEMATAGYNLPMSAIRAAIIPNSEVKSLVELWNKDVGTYKVD